MHIAPRAQSKMALRTTHVLDIRRCASDTTYASNQEEARDGRKQREVEGHHGSRKGAPTNTKNQGDASTSADNKPLRAVSPPAPPTRDDRPTIRLLPLLLSLPRTTTRVFDLHHATVTTKTPFLDRFWLSELHHACPRYPIEREKAGTNYPRVPTPPRRRWRALGDPSPRDPYRHSPL